MIDAIKSDVSAATAEGVVRSSSPGAVVRVARKLYYPYFWFHVRYTAATLFGKTSLRASCLVDGRTRLGSTTDEFDRETLAPDARDILAVRIDESDARRVADKYVAYVMRARKRAFIAPDVELLERALVHKPFWIVECCGDDGGLRVLVDGLTAGVHVLASSPVPMTVREPARYGT